MSSKLVRKFAPPVALLAGAIALGAGCGSGQDQATKIASGATSTSFAAPGNSDLASALGPQVAQAVLGTYTGIMHYESATDYITHDAPFTLTLVSSGNKTTASFNANTIPTPINASAIVELTGGYQDPSGLSEHLTLETAVVQMPQIAGADGKLLAVQLNLLVVSSYYGPYVDPTQSQIRIGDCVAAGGIVNCDPALLNVTFDNIQLKR